MIGLASEIYSFSHARPFLRLMFVRVHMRKVQFLSILFLNQASMLWSSNSEFWLLTPRPTNPNKIKLPDYHTVLYADDEDLHGRNVLQSGELIVSKYVAESITMIAGHFGHEGLCQLRTEVLYAVDKGFVVETSCNHCY